MSSTMNSQVKLIEKLYNINLSEHNSQIKQQMINTVIFFHKHEPDEMYKGYYYYKIKDYNRAKKYIQKAIAKGSLQAYILMGVIMDIEGYINKAKKYYRFAIRKKSTKARVYLGELLKREGRFPEAKLQFSLAIKKGNVDAMCRMGDVLELENKMKGAIKYYLMAMYHGYAYGMYKMALINKGNRDEYEKYLLMAVEKDHVESMNLLGKLYQKEEQKLKAIECFTRSVFQNSSEGMLHLGLLILSEGRIKEGERLLLMAIDYGNSVAMYHYGMLIKYKKRDALKYFLMSLDNGCTLCLKDKRVCRWARNMGKEFEIYFYKALFNKGYYRYTKLMCNLLLKYGEDIKDVIYYYKKTVDNGNYKFINNLCSALIDYGNKDEAIKYYKIGINNNVYGTIAGLGILYEDMGNINEAKIYYKISVRDETDRYICDYLLNKADKNIYFAVQNLCNILIQDGKIKEAKKYYKLAIRKGYTGLIHGL